MGKINLTPTQLSIIEEPISQKIFVEGYSGSGKTTCAVERMLYLMKSDVPGNSILVLIPHRLLAEPYLHVLKTPGLIAGGPVSVLTPGGLARRMIELFWPVIAEKAGFAQPNDPPIFLSLETSQYFMANIVDPMLQKGYFNSITIPRHRIYSQILDNLNKSAVVGFPLTQIRERLETAWIGEPEQAAVYQDSQDCAIQFRELCLANNLLDFSLQIQVFYENIYTNDLCKNFIFYTYKHIIADNIEEDVPVTHDLFQDLIPHTVSALLIYDLDAGYRRFLGADPDNAYRLKGICEKSLALKDSFIAPPKHILFRSYMRKQLHQTKQDIKVKDVEPLSEFIYGRYFPEMLDSVCKKIDILVNRDHNPPGEIAILAPFISDSLRFSVTSRLKEINVPLRTHRPSRALREEPTTQCVLTLAALANPSWNSIPLTAEVMKSLMIAIDGLDPIRAYLLTQIIYKKQDDITNLTSFDQIVPEIQKRITTQIGKQYEKLRLWLLEYRQHGSDELDQFISRIFEEILSQVGYNFHNNFEAGETITKLIKSIKNFQDSIGFSLNNEGLLIGKEYIKMVKDGMIGAQYMESWQLRPENAVLLAPAYTFLMSNNPVYFQFWLDIGNPGWSERIFQPLTQPFVLSRSWSQQEKWTDVHEYKTKNVVLYRLTTGLINRCRKQIYLGYSEYSEQGFEQRGQLLRSLSRIFIESRGTD